MSAPPLPPGVDGFAIEIEGDEVTAVTVADASRLTGLPLGKLEEFFCLAMLPIVEHPSAGRLVPVEALWAAIPAAVKG